MFIQPDRFRPHPHILDPIRLAETMRVYMDEDGATIAPGQEKDDKINHHYLEDTKTIISLRPTVLLRAFDRATPYHASYSTWLWDHPSVSRRAVSASIFPVSLPRYLVTYTLTIPPLTSDRHSALESPLGKWRQHLLPNLTSKRRVVPISPQQHRDHVLPTRELHLGDPPPRRQDHP